MRHAFVFAIVLLLTAPLRAQDVPVPPKDAEWTIFCASITGPDHFAQAAGLRKDLVRRTHMKDWYVVHTDNDSKLFYGYYRTVESAVDPKESARSKSDLHKIEELTGANGEHPFARAGIMEIVPPDPDGPPQWNLVNVNRGKGADDPTRAYYTLQIAAFKDSPERKKVAVDMVRDARNRGVEAYYYHGESVSSVCIGAWPKSAVKSQEAVEGSSDESLIVSNTPLTPQTVQALESQAPKNAPVRVVSATFEPVDPTLLKAMKDYPDHYLNGDKIIHKETDPSTGQVTRHSDPSIIVRVPDASPSLLDSTAGAPIVPPPPAALARPATPTGTGKLKSLDD